MPFIPHTEDDVREMLATIGVESIDALFDEIPAALASRRLESVPEGMTEMEIMRLMEARAARDGRYLNFIGAGAYEHHIPAAVWQIVGRGEFYSAYTPYQAEASQGTLQLIYEYQSMMVALTGLEVSNASLYDGASGLAEAVSMAVRVHKRARRVALPRTVHPYYRRAVQTLVTPQAIEIVEVAYDRKRGVIAEDGLPAGELAALVIPQPNFFGMLEDVHVLTDWAHARGALAIALVNPTTLAVLEAPGRWGGRGADIAVGDGQPLGVPLSSGGPYFGFMCCKSEYVRQMPGRIVGRTVDVEGRPGFTLTLQAREQHIRRAKATSNICSNQGLMVVAATIYLALLGPEGLRRVALQSHANTRALVAQLTAIEGVSPMFEGPFFHEAALALATPVAGVLHALEAQGIVGGFDLTSEYPELGHGLLVCATETRQAEDIATYAHHLARIMSRQHLPPPCPIQPKL